MTVLTILTRSVINQEMLLAHEIETEVTSWLKHRQALEPLPERLYPRKPWVQ